jgi:hypothetical protein
MLFSVQISEFRVGDAKQGASTGFIGPMHLIDGKVVHDPPNKLTEPVEHQGPIQWTALQDKYFVAALIPQEPSAGSGS